MILRMSEYCFQGLCLGKCGGIFGIKSERVSKMVQRRSVFFHGLLVIQIRQRNKMNIFT